MTCRAGSSSGRRWRRCCCWSQRFFCWTSPPRASTAFIKKRWRRDVYKRQGFLVTKKAITENDIKNYDLTNYGSDYTETIRNRGEFVYKNDFGTIRRSINGKEIVIFTVPTWQVLYKIFDIIKYISLAGLFVFGFVIPVIRKTNGYK